MLQTKEEESSEVQLEVKKNYFKNFKVFARAAVQFLSLPSLLLFY
jgi:hypothetical protein